jgi:hypothetical protein
VSTEKRPPGSKRKNVIDMAGLDFDWARQRVSINHRLAQQSPFKTRPVWKWGVALASVLVIMLGTYFWWSTRSELANGEQLAFYAEEEYSEIFIPEGLYVLNGFTSTETDFADTVNYITAVEEEDL